MYLDEGKVRNNVAHYQAWVGNRAEVIINYFFPAAWSKFLKDWLIIATILQHGKLWTSRYPQSTHLEFGRSYLYLKVHQSCSKVLFLS